MQVGERFARGSVWLKGMMCGDCGLKMVFEASLYGACFIISLPNPQDFSVNSFYTWES